MNASMRFDGKMDILVFTIAGFIIHDLDVSFGLVAPSDPKYKRVHEIQDAFVVAASCLPYSGSDNSMDIKKAFRTRVNSLGTGMNILPSENVL